MLLPWLGLGPVSDVMLLPRLGPVSDVMLVVLLLLLSGRSSSRSRLASLLRGLQKREKEIWSIKVEHHGKKLTFPPPRTMTLLIGQLLKLIAVVSD
jgi:hypothetical protein